MSERDDYLVLQTLEVDLLLSFLLMVLLFAGSFHLSMGVMLEGISTLSFPLFFPLSFPLSFFLICTLRAGESNSFSFSFLLFEGFLRPYTIEIGPEASRSTVSEVKERKA